MKMTFSPEGRDFSQTVVCHVSEDFLSSSTFGNLSCDVKSDPSTNVCGKWAGKLSDEVPNNVQKSNWQDTMQASQSDQGD